MFQKLIIGFLFMFNIHAFASFEEGKILFEKECASCHKAYISFKKLKENFFERNNQLLNLTIPTENMLAWAIMESSKKIGDPDDIEMRQIEIEEYLKNYLENPNLLNSICDDTVKQYYKKKEPIKLSDKKAELLSIYFMGYKKNRLKTVPKEVEVLTQNYNEKRLLEKAQTQGKHFIVYATSKSCYYCKKMDKEVLMLKEIQNVIKDDYIFLKVDVDHIQLPFNLKSHFKGMTPTFFVLTSSGELLNTYPGAWVKNDFLQILKENL